jgi:hypothetical protein
MMALSGDSAESAMTANCAVPSAVVRRASITASRASRSCAWVIFFVPENQCNTWLKEVSTLARVLKNHPEFQNLELTPDLTEVRNILPDMAHQGRTAGHG